MITVKVKAKKHSVRINGHAEYAEKGKDIVCAAVSFSFYNLANMLLDYPEQAWREKLKMKDSKTGNASIDCVPTGEYETLIDHDFYYFLVGLTVLAEQYPEHINLVVTEK